MWEIFGKDKGMWCGKRNGGFARGENAKDNCLWVVNGGCV